MSALTLPLATLNELTVRAMLQATKLERIRVLAQTALDTGSAVGSATGLARRVLEVLEEKT